MLITGFEFIIPYKEISQLIEDILVLSVSSRTYCAKPFLKWAGGKGQLIVDISRHLPEVMRTGEIESYIEPFVGGGAVFFYLAQRYSNLKRFHLLDANEDLINCYICIRENIGSVISELLKLQESYFSLSKAKRKNFYLRVRDEFNEQKAIGTRPSVAAMLIFLNRNCYNGLYRVNRKGFFNVPFGDYKKPQICNDENLRAVSELLQKAKIQCADFETAKKFVGRRTFVYFDPPYRPLNKTASFTSYSKDSFSEDEQIRLAKFCREIDRKKAFFLLSNSDPKNENPDDDFFERHYEDYGFKIHKVRATRAINCKAAGRGPISELLITNYEVQNEEPLLYPDT